MVVGIFGGSFNPAHVSHVLAIGYVLSVYELDGVIVIPVFRHVFGKELAPFDDRMEMAKLAVGWIPGVEVSDIERRLGGDSRTLYTIEALLEEKPERELRLIIGADVLADLPKWHRFERIAELAPPIVIGRAGVEHVDAPPSLLPEVSSTQIRALAEEGRLDEAAHLLPRAVKRYLETRQLYRDS